MSDESKPGDAGSVWRRYFPPEISVKLLLGTSAITIAMFSVLSATRWWPTDTSWVPSMWLLGAVALVAVVSGLAGLVIQRESESRRRTTTPPGPHDVDCDSHAREFLRFQLGVGYALLMVSIFSGTVAAGVGHRLLSQTAAESAKSQADLCGPRLLLAINMAIVGSLFYVANSLRKKRACKDAFDPDLFWSGLWYRMGEAVLFTLVIFLIVRMPYLKQGSAAATAQPTQIVESYDLMLPILGLLMGMFIRTGERLVFGLAERVFAAASVLIPDVKPRTPEPRNAHANRSVTASAGVKSLPNRDIAVPAASTAQPAVEQPAQSN